MFLKGKLSNLVVAGNSCDDGSGSGYGSGYGDGDGGGYGSGSDNNNGLEILQEISNVS